MAPITGPRRLVPDQGEVRLSHSIPLVRRDRAGWCLLLACLLAGILLAIPASGPATVPAEPPSPGVYRHPEPGYVYRFPRDHGSHEEFRTEWWYYTGHLSTKSGRRFGYQLTFFRRGVTQEAARKNPSRWAIRHLYLAHVALTDLDRSRFSYAEKLSRAGLGKAGADPGQLHVWIDRWKAEASPAEPHHHHLQATGDDFALDLTVASEKQPVVHGQGGVSRKGAAPEQASHYYSLTRLSTSGTITVAGAVLPVTGLSWMDHEFGSGDLGANQVGWDWFGIQLDNRTDVMLYRLRLADGTIDPASSGSLILPDGRVQALAASDVRVEVLEFWTSRLSGAHYPARWRIAIPSADLMLEVTPELTNQELLTTRSTQVTYWEGAARITGTQRGMPLAGAGYVELTGYAERFRPRL
ncbi:MAG: carotenoid 1,2-hydratase [Nitrospirae bacterium]|nr:MAG: carotenoid 1,2-hydratase [Nitrospirota bacterium]